ncbi:MAG: hypothetical protein ABJC79_00310 [Acidimicrobiia bacterium]
MDLPFLEQWVRRTRPRDRQALAASLLQASERDDHHLLVADFLWSLAMDVYVLDAEDVERVDRLVHELVEPTHRLG